ncbi:hypothetical protein IWQ47_003860 [Aquimarina sp. EL_43]|uniref:hypothetical protein n=1 Tax=Aquimarina TaxID=290174 RepID=UPI000471DC14|nr:MULTISPECIES: hypothetical protein [Aquimarina]MBG6132635.1 hypothetical protein [Aquimarina sp. EL_35]MBG6152766.1 hypothetical protein [Aquimarina sp. EL_32]MBG6170773.1 hypothetical protein [Aquimarina sp. EL_43]
MKDILNLSGVQKLSKEQQQNIKGAFVSAPYCKDNRFCCVRFPNGTEMCDYGYCDRWGRCTWA